MKVLLHYQRLRFIWLAKPTGRHFHRDRQLWTPLTLADFEAINRCEKPLPKNFNFAADVLDQWSQKEKSGEKPANPALWWVNGKGDEVKWSFQELGSLSRKAANVLTKPCGLQRGDRVAVILPRIPEWWLINVACMRTGQYWLDLTPSDIMWNMSDTGWIKAAIGSVFSTWLQGACVFVHRMAQFDTDTFLDTLTTYPITTLCSAPTVYRILVQKDLKRYQFKRLRHCVTGGEPLNPEGIICANRKGQEIKPGSMGKGVVPYDVQIIDENGNILPPGKEGEIALRLEYRIGPFEVESALIEHPAVVESAVVSSPDPIRGEVVKAFVVLAAPFKSSNREKLTTELQDHVEFVQELPKTITGKIKRNVLRDQEWGR
ncbi:hypothetical protein A6R68_08680, partial [Neotoma lepida]